MATLRSLRLALPLVGLVFGTAHCSRASSESQDAVGAAVNAKPEIVISQVFGGGGNEGAIFSHDFVELFNRGTVPARLTNTAIQYVKDSESFDAAVDVAKLPDVELAPGQYFLVQLGTNALGGVPLPSPDHVTTGAEAITISKDKGKIALVFADALLGSCGGESAAPCSATWIDLVGYGSASQAEGSPTPATSLTTAAFRKGGGCVDTQNNAADFEIAAPAPRNSRSSANCASPPVTPPTPPAPPSPDPAPSADVLLNEVLINPPTSGDAPWEFIELQCKPNASLSGIYVAAIEAEPTASDSTVPGAASLVFDLSSETCGANGLVMVKASGGHEAAKQTKVVTSALLASASTAIPNSTTTIVVIKSASHPIVQGDDYDSNDDGTLDLPEGAAVIDGVSFVEPSVAVTAHEYAPILRQASGTPDAASRIHGDKRALNVDAWYSGDIAGDDVKSVSYDTTKASANMPAGGFSLTPGAPNGGSATDGAENGTGRDDDSAAQTDPDEAKPGKQNGAAPSQESANDDARVPITPAREVTTTHSACSAAPQGRQERTDLGWGPVVLGLGILAGARRRKR